MELVCCDDAWGKSCHCVARNQSLLLGIGMKLFNAVAGTAVFLVTSAITASPINARPWLYMDTFSHGGTYQICITNASKVLKANGFTNLEVDENTKAKISEVTGYNQDDYLTAAIECNQKLGITGFSVSGLDNLSTYNMYGVLFDAEW